MYTHRTGIFLIPPFWGLPVWPIFQAVKQNATTPNATALTSDAATKSSPGLTAKPVKWYTHINTSDPTLGTHSMCCWTSLHGVRSLRLSTVEWQDLLGHSRMGLLHTINTRLSDDILERRTRKALEMAFCPWASKEMKERIRTCCSSYHY